MSRWSLVASASCFLGKGKVKGDSPLKIAGIFDPQSLKRNIFKTAK
jgi:hypothetical protein